MSVPHGLAKLTGSWAATNRVWTVPGEPALVSTTSAELTLEGQGQFLSLRYTWTADNEPASGLLVFGQESGKGKINAAWIDSWHNKDSMMSLVGSLTAHDGVSLLGSYPAPSGPDWGWRITLEPGEDSELVLRMFNITPAGEEFLGVEAVYTRSIRP